MLTKVLAPGTQVTTEDLKTAEEGQKKALEKLKRAQKAVKDSEKDLKEAMEIYQTVNGALKYNKGVLI